MSSIYKSLLFTMLLCSVVSIFAITILRRPAARIATIVIAEADEGQIIWHFDDIRLLSDIPPAAERCPGATPDNSPPGQVTNLQAH